VPASVVDERGHTVAVSGRGTVSADPSLLAIGHGQAGSPRRVTAWAGPWPVEERWWDPLTRRRRARFQLVTEDGQAHLVVLTEGRWWLAATYD
jgi:protein ImuB